MRKIFNKIIKKLKSIKTKMFLLGFIITLSFFVFIITVTYTNKNVLKALNLTEANVETNKFFIDKLNLLDLIQISQTRLTRFAKDLIITKDELVLYEEKFHEIKKEVENLKNYTKIFTDFIEGTHNKFLTKYSEETKKLKISIDQLADYAENQLKKAIINSHDKINILNDELLKLELFLDDILKESTTILDLIESLLKKKSEGFSDLEKFKINSETIELILKIKKKISETILLSITTISFNKNGYIDEKRVALIKENLDIINRYIEPLSNRIYKDENLYFKNLISLTQRLDQLINKELLPLFEKKAIETSNIEITFLTLDNKISEYSDEITFIISRLGDFIKNEVNKSGTLVSKAQFSLRKELAKTIFIIHTVAFSTITIVTIFFTLISNSIVTPLLKAVNMAKDIERGNFTHRLSIKRDDEIGDLALALDDMAEQLESFTKVLFLKNRELEKEIEERKKIELEVRKLNEELEEKVEERTKQLEKAHEELLVRERLAILGHFAGSISHEIRNPLSVIASSVYFLNIKLKDADDKIKNHLEKIKKSVDKANNIIQSLLNLAKMKAPDKEECDLIEIFEDVIKSYPIGENIKIRKEFYKDKINIFAEREQLYMAFKNMIKNSVEALENNDGEIIINVKEAQNKYLIITISDTGPGIDKSIKDKIFQPLFSTKTHGIGFGLSITKMIIENHGGSIKALSKKGKGATFIIKLPIFKELKNGKNKNFSS